MYIKYNPQESVGGEWFFPLIGVYSYTHKIFQGAKEGRESVFLLLPPQHWNVLCAGLDGSLVWSIRALVLYSHNGY